MSSIFDLKQSASELPQINQGVAKLTYSQNAPLRDVSGTNFPNGAIRIRFEVSGSRWWIPARSYIRLRGAIGTTANAARQITNGDDIAPNMGLMANLFQSMEFRIADKTVSRVSDFVAQIDSLEKRLTKSKSWLDSVGKDLEWWDPDFSSRQNKISSDGFLGRVESQHVAPAPITRLLAGFDAATTTAWTQATRLLTFALGAVDLINGPGILHKGDVIIMNGAGNFGAGHRYEITNVVNATTCNAFVQNAANPGDVAGEVDAFTLERIQDFQSNRSPNRNQIEVVWQPPLSIFKVTHAMPSGKYELVLNPQNSQVYMKRAIESLNADKAQGDAAGQFNFIVDDMYLYLAQVEGPVVDDVSYFLNLEEIRCQVENIDNNTSLQQKNFDVSPNSYALTVAFQDQLAGTDTRHSASKFKVRAITAAPDTYPSGELALQRFYIQYNGENKPSPDADPNYAGNIDYMSQLYADTQLYSGAYFDCGGAEDKYDWKNRGLLMYYGWPKDGASEATRVNVNYQFQTALDADSGRVLLFDHVQQTVLISVKDGRVIDVVSS